VAWTDWVGFASPAIQSRPPTKAKHAPKWKITDLKYLKHEPEVTGPAGASPKSTTDVKETLAGDGSWMDGWITLNGGRFAFGQRGCGWMGDSGINPSGSRQTIQRLHW
jgi:hypothetical protein